MWSLVLISNCAGAQRTSTDDLQKVTYRVPFCSSSTACRLPDRATMKRLLVLLVLLSLTALGASVPWILSARASSSREFKVAPAAAMSCVDRYNSLLKSGKAALIRGNRAASVDALLRAERLLESCPALQDGSSRQAPALVLDMPSGSVGVPRETADDIRRHGCHAPV